MFQGDIKSVVAFTRIGIFLPLGNKGERLDDFRMFNGQPEGERATRGVTEEASKAPFPIYE